MSGSAFKPVQKIGRQMGSSPITTMLESGINQSKVFTLASGLKVTFSRQIIPAAEIESRTFVDAKINGRDQDTLTEESVKDIVRTIVLQQFFPAIGRVVGDRIEVLDGSRRRAACLFANVDFEVLVASETISVDDARQLAADIQTAKEHNLRELGLRFQVMHDQGMSKSEIAKAEGISNAKVTRAFQAAAVPGVMVSLFPVVSELTLPDYKFLLDFSEEVKAKDADLEEITLEIMDKIDGDDEIGSMSPEEVKTRIMLYFRDAQISRKPPSAVSPVVTTELFKGSDRRIYARRKVNPKNRTFSYEFSRIDKEVQEKIDEAIQAILASEQK